eukprot:5168377-Amphidinium_carterae.2
MPQMPMGFMKGTSSSELQSAVPFDLAVPRMPKVPKKSATQLPMICNFTTLLPPVRLSPLS